MLMWPCDMIESPTPRVTQPTTPANRPSRQSLSNCPTTCATPRHLFISSFQVSLSFHPFQPPTGCNLFLTRTYIHTCILMFVSRLDMDRHNHKRHEPTPARSQREARWCMDSRASRKIPRRTHGPKQILHCLRKFFIFPIRAQIPFSSRQELMF